MRKDTIFGFCLVFGACTTVVVKETAPVDTGTETSVRTDVKTDSGVTVAPDSSVPPVTKPDASSDRMAVVVPDTRLATVPDTTPLVLPDAQVAVPDAEVPVDLQPVVPDTAPNPVVPDAKVPVIPDASGIPDKAPVVDLAPTPDLRVSFPDAFRSPDRVVDLKPDTIAPVDLKPATLDTSPPCGGLNQACCTSSVLGQEPSPLSWPWGFSCSASYTVCLDAYKALQDIGAGLNGAGTCITCGGLNQHPCWGQQPGTTTFGYYCKTGLTTFTNQNGQYLCG